MKPITFVVPITLKAAGGKPRRFKILAYSGGVLPVEGFQYPVIVDLQGLDAGAVPVVLNHRLDTDSTIGDATSVMNTGRNLSLAGLVTGVSRQVRDVLSAADAGHRWQASIGCMVHDSETIANGQSVRVNGQTFVGPVIVARRSALRECSVLPVGADNYTSVNLAASAAKGKKMDMDFETWATDKGFDITNLSPDAKAFLTSLYDTEMNSTTGTPSATSTTVPAAATALIDLRASRAADHVRIAAVEAVASRHPQICATAIRDGWTPEKTELAILKSRNFMTVPSNQVRSGAPDSHQVLCASFALNCGASQAFLAKQYGDGVIDEASRRENRGASLKTIFDSVLRAAGDTERSNSMSDTYIRAAFSASRKLEASGLSTMGLPGILSNIANKLLLEGYQMVRPTWRAFCAIGNLQDLKEAKRYRLTPSGDFEELASGGLIKHAVLNQEDSYSITAKTYAKMVALDRAAIINDDLSVFESLPTALGRMAAVKLEKLVFSLLLANGGSFFSVGNTNYLTGAGSALSITSLTAAEKAFLLRTDANGDPVLIVPDTLLVPPSLSVTANQLVRDTQVVAVGVGASAALTPSSNPHAGKFGVEVSPWLENANLSGYSSTGWYLLAKPQGKAGLLEVGFLNGQENPTIENGELDFDRLGVALRGYHDIGVAQQDPKFGLLNAGV